MCPMHSRFPDLCCTAQDLFNDNFQILERPFLTKLCKIQNWNIFLKWALRGPIFSYIQNFSKFWLFRSKIHFCSIFQIFVKSLIFDKKMLIFSCESWDSILFKYINRLFTAYVAFEISGFKRVSFFENFIFDERIKKLRV